MDVEADTTAGEAASLLLCLHAADLIRFSNEPALQQGVDTVWSCLPDDEVARAANELCNHLAVVEGA
ncbi:hypothetical protein [Streptomyces sp. NPDC054849]